MRRCEPTFRAGSTPSSTRRITAGRDTFRTVAACWVVLAGRANHAGAGDADVVQPAPRLPGFARRAVSPWPVGRFSGGRRRRCITDVSERSVFGRVGLVRPVRRKPGNSGSEAPGDTSRYPPKRPHDLWHARGQGFKSPQLHSRKKPEKSGSHRLSGSQENGERAAEVVPRGTTSLLRRRSGPIEAPRRSPYDHAMTVALRHLAVGRTLVHGQVGSSSAVPRGACLSPSLTPACRTVR
jgi:hypothetical protein